MDEKNIQRNILEKLQSIYCDEPNISKQMKWNFSEEFNLTTLEIRNINLLKDDIKLISDKINILILFSCANFLEYFPLDIEFTKLHTIMVKQSHFGNDEILRKSFNSRKRIKMIDIIQCNIPFIKDSFNSCPDLEYLNLINCEIQEIQNCFEELDQISKICINQNHLEFIPNSIRNCMNLKDLSISDNDLETIPENFFDPLKKIKKLDLQANKLTKCEKSLFFLDNLTDLQIGFNDIVNIPEEIANLRNLQSLDISYLPIKQLPTSISKLEKLTSLTMSLDYFHEIPNEIVKLPNLESLYIIGQLKKMDNLTNSQSLRRVYIPHKILLDQDLKKLQEQIPNIQIFQYRPNLKLIQKRFKKRDL